MNQSYGTTNVGFDPGVVNGTAPVYTKGRYQQMLAEQMYGERDFRRALEDPWGEWVTRSVVYYGIIMGLFAFCMAGVLIRGSSTRRMPVGRSSTSDRWSYSLAGACTSCTPASSAP